MIRVLKFKVKSLKLVLECVEAVLLLFVFIQYGEAQDKIKKEIIIQVKPNIIALPEGEIAKVPLSAARVRSTELRELNKKYKAVSIEKVYKLKEESKIKIDKGAEIKGYKDKHEQPKEKKGLVDFNAVFSKDLRKKLKAEGKETEQVKDVYIINFEFEPEDYIDMDILLDDYKSLDVVLNAQEVLGRKNE